VEINLLTPNILSSKAISNTQNNITNKISAEQVKSDLDTIISDNANLLHQNTEAANVQSARYLDSPFLSSTLPTANADGTYTVDGVLFSKKEFEQCRSVMQAAVSGIETSGTIDYINYAQMSIAANAVQSFAETNLNEEQTGILTNTIQKYNSAVISAENKLLSNGGYTLSNTGAVSEYYGVQKTYSDVEIKAINDLIDEINRVSGGNKAHVGSDFVSTTASATNQSLIAGISDLFANVDLNNTAAVNGVMEQYKSLMTPVYLASGINNEHGALTRVLNSSTSKLADLINSIAFSVNYQPINISV